jgi:hypothetical protein
MKNLLKSYFYWTYPRGSFHYDVMVTLILAFIFVTPRFFNFGGKPSIPIALAHPIQVANDGRRGLIVTVNAEDVPLALDTRASKSQVKRVLRKAVEPITGDAVFVEYWETVHGADGNNYWKVWAHR